MASSENLEAYLFDYENGKTTGQFVKELKKKCDITFLDLSKLCTHNILPLVIIVRSTTERAEEDLDAALEKAHGVMCPIIMVYFHMKVLSDCFKTEDSVKGKDKYKHIPAIIDMDFSKESLTSLHRLKDINKSALGRLKDLVKDLKDDIGIIQLEMNKRTLYVYDKSKTDISEKVTNELKCLMEGKLRIETTEVPCGGEPLLVIFCAKNLPSEEDGLWEKFKDCDPSNIIMICLLEKEDDNELKFEGAPVAATIQVELYRARSCVLTYIKCEEILDFVSAYHVRQTNRRKKTDQQSENQNFNTQLPLTDPPFVQDERQENWFHDHY